MKFFHTYQRGEKVLGFVHSIETFSTVDGPGIRYVIFMQGCNLRCKFCHNPDTWKICVGDQKTAKELIDDIKKYKIYLKDGGVTVSGGEPLLQIDFLIELFKELKKLKIHTCLDTSGIVFDKNNLELKSKFDILIKDCDLVLLDLKHIDNKKHIFLTGQGNSNVLDFFKYLSQINKKVWVRYVLVPTINNDIKELKMAAEFLNKFENIEKVEVLPFHKLGEEKYKKLGIKFPFESIDLPTEEEIELAKKILEIKK
jgi:pyruvate formate lyase activating enzyme